MNPEVMQTAAGVVASEPPLLLRLPVWSTLATPDRQICLELKLIPHLVSLMTSQFVRFHCQQIPSVINPFNGNQERRKASVVNPFNPLFPCASCSALLPADEGSGLAKSAVSPHLAWSSRRKTARVCPRNPAGGDAVGEAAAPNGRPATGER